MSIYPVDVADVVSSDELGVIDRGQEQEVMQAGIHGRGDMGAQRGGRPRSVS